MCTLIAAFQPDQQRALVVAANRDEDLERPFEGPQPRVLAPEGTRIFAPKDLESGGTWMGLSEHGVFAALTNRYGVPRDRARRSRGAIVLDALRPKTAKDSFTALQSLEGDKENGFHLFIADRSDAFAVIADGRSIDRVPLKPGVHIFTERGFGAAPSARQTSLEARFAHPAPEALRPEALMAVLGDRSGGPFDGVCVHVPERNYGTRSSAVVELFADARTPTWWSVLGPPGSTPWAPLSVRFEA